MDRFFFLKKKYAAFFFFFYLAVIAFPEPDGTNNASNTSVCLYRSLDVKFVLVLSVSGC